MKQAGAASLEKGVYQFTIEELQQGLIKEFHLTAKEIKRLVIDAERRGKEGILTLYYFVVESRLWNKEWQLYLNEEQNEIGEQPIDLFQVGVDPCRESLLCCLLDGANCDCQQEDCIYCYQQTQNPTGPPVVNRRPMHP
ncbi:MAG: hypothetical protein NTW06_01780 [Candidatus Falkowbacteria bacterium]|nr:hypothetical protein [Candidatus Falkowbacteria bacterium]